MGVMKEPDKMKEMETGAPTSVELVLVTQPPGPRTR